MNFKITYLIGAVILTTFSCGQKTKTDVIDSLSKVEAEHWEPAWPDTAAMRKKYTSVEIVTNMGKLEIVLFDSTPKHKANFLTLVKKGYFNDLLFHRVKNKFMVQAGDPDSKTAKKGQALGQGGPGYTVPAEFSDTLYHIRGALAAARTGDEVNPEKRSSGSQFYIVTGDKTGTLALRNAIKNRAISSFLMQEDNLSYRLRMQNYQGRNDMAAMNVLLQEMDVLVKPIIDSLYNAMPQRVKQLYATWGGFPALDGDYTIFGFLISGFDVLDKIQNVKTDGNDRPVEDVKILSARIINEPK